MPGFNVGGLGGGGPPNTQETARRHRFDFETFEPLDSILLFAHKAQRPIPEIDRVIMHHGQDEIYLPGKNRWRPIEISFYEAIDGSSDSVASKIYDWWSQSVISIQESKVGSDYKKRATLQMLDGQGSSVWKYMLINCWPISVTPDTLDYADNGVAAISFQVVMDKVKESE